jgi:hypothetical protein
VELDELHVDQLRAGVVPERVAVAGALPGVRGDLPRLSGAAGGHHDRTSAEGDEASVGPPVREGAADTVAVLEQAGDDVLHVDLDAAVNRLVLEGPDQLEPGAVTHMDEPAIRVPSERALGHLAVRCPVENGAPALELLDALGRLPCMELRHPPVVQVLPSEHGVLEVHLPVVLRGNVPERGGDSALRHHGVRLAEQRLADHGGARAVLGGRDRGAQARAAGADPEHVVVVPFDVHHTILGSWKAPNAAKRM